MRANNLHLITSMSTPEPNSLRTATLQLLLFLLFFFSSPSPSLARTLVTHLPGFQGPLPFYLETGYVNVDEENGSEYFYYFIKSERDPLEDPVILWLTGGPRCSAFGALAFEMGPLRFAIEEYNGSLPNLIYNPYSWTKVSNMIFLDSPTGSGFSFSRRPEGYDEGDVSWSKHAHKFLIKDHQMFSTNPLYIGGDSYGGKAAPLIAYQLDLEEGIQPALNLKGYLIGNPITGAKIDYNARLPYAHGVGIISTEFFQETQRFCGRQDIRYPKTAQCSKHLDAFDKFYSEIEQAHILDIKCPNDWDDNNLMSDRKIYMELFDPPVRPQVTCRSYAYFLSYYWANSDATRRALQIRKGTVKEWIRCKKNLPYTKDIESNIKYQYKLTTKGYRALVYSGDHDLVVPFLGTHEWIRSLNFSIMHKWRSWHFDGQVAGYTTTYSNNLTFATIKGAGHSSGVQTYGVFGHV